MPKTPTFRNISFALLGILIIASLVRYWGIGFGLPYISARPDEEQIVGIIDSLKHSLHPGGLNYPSLYKYIVLFFYLCYFLLGMICSKFKSVDHLLAVYASDPTIFFLINRCISAFLGTATVFLVYKLAKELTDKRTALISALFTSLAYLHVKDSHFGTVDVPATFFMVWAVLYILKSYRTGALKDYLFAGILTGAAASTKYTGALLIFPMLVAHLFSSMDSKENKQLFTIDKRIVYFIIAAAFIFLLGTPYILLDLPQLKASMSLFIKTFFPKKKPLALHWHQAWYYLKFILWPGLGWSLLLASLGGIFILLKKDFKKAIILFSFLSAYYVLHSLMRLAFLRYMVPLVPFLCITAAVCINYIYNKLGENLKPLLKKMLLFFLIALSIWPSLCNIIQLNSLITKKDSRLIASEWILRNIKDGSSICMLVPGTGSFRLDNKQLSYINKTEIGQLSEQKTVKYKFWKYNDSMCSFEFFKRLQNSLPDYLIIVRFPVRIKKCTKITEQIINTSYTLKQAFEVTRIDPTKKFMYFDGFYIPSDDFTKTTNPGPNIYIYQRNDLINDIAAIQTDENAQ